MEKVIKKERKIWLDATKGVGILLVVLSHCYGLKGNWYLLIAGYMPMFYMLSGYSMKSDVLLEHEVPKKAKRLLAPYFLWSFFLVAFSMAWKALMGGFTISALKTAVFGIFYSRYCMNLIDSESNTFLLQSFNSPMWFLTSLFLAFIVARVYIGAGRNMRKYLRASFIIVTICLSWFSHLLPWSFDTIFIAALFMIAGQWMKTKKVEEITKKQLALALPLLVITYIILSNYNGEINMSVRVYGQRGILSIALFFLIGVSCTLIYCIICRLLEQTILMKGLAFIGRNSITILCSHLLIYHIYQVGIQMLGIQQWNPNVMSLLGCLVAVIAGLVLSAFANWLSKRQTVCVSSNLQSMPK